ncbi:hypothetical protein MD484_g6266, partial [Candolleomyces efflorescens]
MAEIKRAENVIIGDNYGTIYQGTENPQPDARSFHHIRIGELDLIWALEPIPDASHTRDRRISPPDSACFPGTRQTVIRAIVSWADSSLLFNPHVLWLYGYVGCGKSALALAIALKFERRERLVGSFFFFRNTGDRSRMTKFAMTLACQLAEKIPEAKPFIENAVRAAPDFRGLNLVSQLRRLVYEPFKAAWKRGRLLKTFLKGPFLIVIDGLDECEDRRGVEAFIDDMLEFFKKNPLVPLRFLITSRIEHHIQGRLENDRVRLVNLVNHCSRDDIDTFLTMCFEDEKKRNQVIKAFIRDNGDWPTKADKNRLVDHIGGSFIFASSLFKYIIDPSQDASTSINPAYNESQNPDLNAINDALTPMERLPHTLKMNPGLDTLYAQTLARSQHLPHFTDIISTIASLFKPLSITHIAELLSIESFEVVQVLINLQAIIHIPGTDDLPVTFCHTSLRDFLVDKDRSGPFFTSPDYYLHLIYRCLSSGKTPASGTAAASYLSECSKSHFQRFIHLHLDELQPFPRFPQVLDALYTHILAKSQHLPHFSDVISTVALLLDSLSVSGVARLLDITSSDVSRILSNLQPISPIYAPNIYGLTGLNPRVGLQDTASLRYFLTDESRSGPSFVPPAYHLHMSYRCSIASRPVFEAFRPEPDDDVSYITKHSKTHLDLFTRLPPSAQGPLPHFPETLDALYSHILAKAKSPPHSGAFDIIATAAFLLKPPSRAELRGLLNIAARRSSDSEVDRDESDLGRLPDERLVDAIYLPPTVLDPIPHPQLWLVDAVDQLHHPSLLDFLTTESRSGFLYVPASFLLKLSFSHFLTDLQEQQGSLWADADAPPIFAGYGVHWAQHRQFLATTPAEDFFSELEQIKDHLSPGFLPYRYVFTIAIFSCELFRASNETVCPGLELGILTRCMEALALGLERNAQSTWLREPFNLCGASVAEDLVFTLHREQTKRLEDNLQRIGAAVRTKCHPNEIAEIEWDPNVDDPNINPVRLLASSYIYSGMRLTFIAQRFEEWTAMEVYRAISDYGTVNSEGKKSIAYGVLFDKTADTLEALNGTLRSAKRQKKVAFDAELLMMPRDKDVQVVLLEA